MKLLLDELIGMQLVGWDEVYKTLTVKKGEEEYKLVFDDTDEGGCCGYNELFVELHASVEELYGNPVITNVVNNYENDGDSEALDITFFGGSRKLLCISSESGSGSGWCYGACVTVKCKALSIDDCVTSW